MDEGAAVQVGSGSRTARPTEGQEGTAPGDTLLRYAAWVFAIGLAIHTADHFRRGVDILTRHVFWGGVVLATVSLAAIALVFIRHPRAPLVALLVGFLAAIGVSAAHLLPEWSAFSDSLTSAHAEPISWAAVLIEIGGAVALGAAAAVALGRRPA